MIGKELMDYTTRITPKGIVNKRRSRAELVQHLQSEWSKIRYIVGSELRAKIYDKTLGIFFLVLEPLLMASVYYFLTMVLLGSRIGNFGFFNIYVAVVFWRWFSRTIDNSPALFSSFNSVLKQTNYPVYSLVISYIGTEFVNLCIGFCVLVIFLSIFGYLPNLSYIYLIVVGLSQLSMMIFLTLIFSVLGAFFKDLQGVLYAVVGIWFYLSPGIYPAENIPPDMLWVYNLNPFAHLLPAYRSILLNGEAPELTVILAMLALFSFLSIFAFQLLNKVRYYFFSYL